MTKRFTSSGPDEGPSGEHVPRFAHARFSRLKGQLRTPRPMRDNDTLSDVLFRVELALSRLENGDYGYCVICKHPIALERLEQDPSIVVCSDCHKPDT